MTSIAWDYLSDIEKAQLLHFRPDLKDNEDYKLDLKKELDDLIAMRSVAMAKPQVKIRRR